MIKSRSSLMTLMTLLVFSFLVLIGCESDAPTGISPESNEVTILQVANPAAFHKLFYKTAVVTEDNGGFIRVGDSLTGFSGIEIDEGAVNGSQYITMLWRSEQLLQVDFYPEGLQFNKPVEIRLSYKDADLNGINEENLHIYYYNPASDTWEYIDSEVNQDEDYVEGEITHFSRYAVGMD